jgi:ATP-dependent exoDNAse (exonuclease V) alpha subunit
MNIFSNILHALTGSAPRPELIQESRVNVARVAAKIDTPRKIALATVEFDALRPEIERVSFALKQRIPVTLIHGGAGTGKTTLIRKIVEETELNHVVLAFTGVAALNAGGQTIHSFLGLPLRIINLNEIKLKDQLISIIRRLDFIVIDEISMVRADLLDSVDYTLRIHRGQDAPFGGIPMLIVGDFLQLPPIVKNDEIPMLKNLGYQTRFAFAAKCMQNIVPNVIELTTVHRQTDVEFIELLGKVRVGEDVHSTIATLNRLCLHPHLTSNVPVLLTADNASAGLHNARGLKTLPGDTATYIGKINGKFEKGERLRAPEFLDLKIGARVMLVKNDSQKRWVNGSLATVIKLQPRSVWVRLDDNSFEHEVTIETWENIKYEWDFTENRVKANVIGTYSQIPLTLAWAITIHKAQGLTLADVRIDLGGGAFSEGQTYVALSRAKSIQGLSFEKPLKAGDVRVNSHLVSDVRRMVENANRHDFTL